VWSQLIDIKFSSNSGLKYNVPYLSRTDNSTRLSSLVADENLLLSSFTPTHAFDWKLRFATPDTIKSHNYGVIFSMNKTVPAAMIQTDLSLLGLFLVFSRISVYCFWKQLHCNHTQHAYSAFTGRYIHITFHFYQVKLRTREKNNKS